MMRFPYATLALASTVLASVLSAGCHKPSAEPSPISSGRHAASAVRAPATSSALSKTATSSSSPVAKPPVASASASSSPIPSMSSVAKLPGNQVSLGKAAQASFSRVGLIALARKSNKLVVSVWKNKKPQPLSWGNLKPSRMHVSVVDAPSPHVYWVAHGALMKQVVEPSGALGNKEKVASGVLPVAVCAKHATGAVSRDIVLFAKSGGADGKDRTAALWVEGQGVTSLARDISSVVSLSLVHLGGSRFAALVVDGHMGMSPVHAVYVELDPQGVVHAGKDKVVYVAGPAETQMRVSGIQVGMGPVGLLPNFRDSRHFGLLSLLMGYGKGPDARTWWMNYPRGIDPAPLTTAILCGKPSVVAARPVSSAVGGPVSVVWGTVQPDGTVAKPRELASADHVTHAAVWSQARGFWLAFATRQDLRARWVACSGRSAP